MKYFISILFTFCSIVSFSQIKEYERAIFIRPAIDLSRFALPYVHGYKLSGMEFSIDGEVKKKFFPVIEAGIANVEDKRDDYQYKMDGSYGRIGLNYSIIKYRHRLDRNIFFVGFRYAYSQYQHQFDNVIFSNEWGNHTYNIPSTDLNTQWFEGLMGIRGEILKNLFLGFTVRTKIRTATTDFNNNTPYIIPGFGNGDKKANFGVSYTISYAIPIKAAKVAKL